jgi:hypothetical protein
MNKNISSKARAAIIALLAINLAATGFLFAHVFGENTAKSDGGLPDFTESGSYTLYIGTNDKDTYKQIISTETARSIVNGICAKYVGGYTTDDAKGGWFDESGVLTEENTLVYTFIDVEESAVIAIMDEVLAALNQNSVLLEKNSVLRLYYGLDHEGQLR